MLRGRARTDAVSDPPASGWPALYKTVRETDVSKVEDCREDIDTLLVFAGLYSAVLTAFVVESYTHLQQDPQDVIIGLLQQIATRDYISGPGFINSTISSTAPPPFEPPLWAVRVNVLWFTSLLLSLSSASFGILVKQWLREYLAIEYTVPQQRLRARQYRYPALAQWKVFEIAAFLPLLLQLSLGLFFAGLCFFTAAVHKSVGRTTTPLVAAWAFLLVATTIAPLFSPRCPFKTTFLKRSFRGARSYISFVVRCAVPLFHRLPTYANAAASAAWRATMAAVRRGNSLYFLLLSNTADWIEGISWPAWAKYPAWGMLCTVGFPYLVKGLVMWVANLLKKQASKQPVATEEEEAVKEEGEDAEMLLSVDTLMSDDGLLPSMLDVVQQRAGESPGKVVDFVSRMVRRRVERELGAGRLTSQDGVVPDLDVLSKFAWSAVVDVLMQTLHQHIPSALDAKNVAHSWVFGAVFIVLSYPQLDDTTSREVSTIPPQITCPHRIQDAPSYPASRDITPSPHSDRNNQESTDCLRCTMDAFRMLLCQDQDHSHPSLRHLLDEHISSDPGFAILAKGLVRSLYATLMSFFPFGEEGDDIHGSHEALHIILQYGKKFGIHKDVMMLCGQMLTSEFDTRMLLARFASLHPQCRVSKDIQEILEHILFSAVQDSDWTRVQLTSVCKRFCNDGNGRDDDVPLDYVRLGAAFIWWMYSDAGAAEALGNAITKYYHTQGWQKQLRRREYWFSEVPSPTPEEIFKHDQDLACEALKDRGISMHTALIDAFWLFVPEERSGEILQEIRRADRYGSVNQTYTPRPALWTEPAVAEGRWERTSMASTREVGDARRERSSGWGYGWGDGPSWGSGQSWGAGGQDRNEGGQGGDEGDQGWGEGGPGASWGAGTSREARAAERRAVDAASRAGTDGDSDGEAGSGGLSVFAEEQAFRQPGSPCSVDQHHAPRPDFGAGSEGSGYGRGDISEAGAQEVEDAGQAGVGDIFRGTDGEDVEEQQADGETETSAEDQEEGDERIENSDATERETVGEGRVRNDEDPVSGRGAQGSTTDHAIYSSVGVVRCASNGAHDEKPYEVTQSKPPHTGPGDESAASDETKPHEPAADSEL